jgi:serine/threonine protein kinase
MASLRTETHIGPYIVQQILPEGRGGYAQVVVARRASEHGLHEWAALKIAKCTGMAGNPVSAADLAAIYEEALINEADTLWQLRHPGIVTIFPIPLDATHVYHRMRALDLDGQPWYFAMEYLSGGSLEQMIEHQAQLSPPLAVEIAHQVGAALDYVHARGFAHLDVKPTNILFRRPGDAKTAPEAVLVDFGTAQKFRRQVDVEGMTLAYSPPERVRIQKGELPPEAFTDKSAADVYSLGVVLYRMLTGRLPFSGSRSHLTTAILNATPTDIQTHAPALKRLSGLNELLLAMLEKQPGARPRMPAVLARLEQLVPSPRLSREPSVTPPPKRGSIWPGLAVSLFAAAALEAGSIYYLLNNPISTPLVTASPTPTQVIVASPTPLTPTRSAAPAPTVTPLPAIRVPTATAVGKTLTVTPAAEPTVTPVPTFTPTPAPTTGS